MRVWYEVDNGKLAWRYSLSARRSGDGKRIVRRAVRGSASRAVLSGPTGALYCAQL